VKHKPADHPLDGKPVDHQLVVAALSAALLILTAALSAVFGSTNDRMTAAEAVTLLAGAAVSVLGILALARFPQLLNPWHHYAAVDYHHDRLIELTERVNQSPARAERFTLALRIADHMERQAEHLAASRFARAMTALPHPDQLRAEAATWRGTTNDRTRDK